ncbi:amino acid adenylation domain-containing protein [Saccharothrix variisporea]|uniref:Amino acid adenylation domain-containing protein n=1 Tax=Saccharothrix variisporea TaxID=543527 RepID=A0A495XMZ2_9PSEU|nr:amino acid adenylation domain-containing protein [Saccharothrix variisporea]RKT74284.1 amino acid adenylation domain-containing protein [Saccharothrix variisporea]
MTLFARIAETARKHPDRAALEVGGDVLSYRDLLDLADRTAARLAENGTPRAVGLLAARSLPAYAGYLGALRLGATVVPLNPAFPVARNRYMCAQTNVDVLVVDDRGAETADAVVAGTTTTTTTIKDLPPPHRGPIPDNPDDVAYVLFTSGSTGTPKGVPIRHRNLATYLPFCTERYEIGPGARLSQAADLTFDISVFDLFASWTSGATVVVPQADELLVPVRFVAGRGITHWFSVPSVISIARRLRALRPNVMPGLRWSIFGGERLTHEQARAWATAAPNSAIVNVYGPTETTITVTDYRLPADPAQWPRTSNGTVPIGQVFPHVDAVILDDGRPAREGELHVRGEQRFDGYADPAANAGRFSPDGDPTPRSWYRTGDRVREENGVLVHVGRVDHQVKISGYRVELGEIEGVLRGHDRVHDAVVVAVPGDGGELVLHACYTGEPGLDRELAEAAGRRLPVYMLPFAYRHFDAFPVNANGKVDRLALADLLAPPPEVEAPSSSAVVGREVTAT